ncbi:hypothetical protein Syun_005645 [Stephania yunnanensis]|uniref:Uncharacterized protein n=1 Tax=Stephania yunnanensis TaxID=152371 RepID=A0AAP0L559_9MAGN
MRGVIVVAGGAPLVKFSHHRPCLSLSSYDFISLFRFNYASSFFFFVSRYSESKSPFIKLWSLPEKGHQVLEQLLQAPQQQVLQGPTLLAERLGAVLLSEL